VAHPDNASKGGVDDATSGSAAIRWRSRRRPARVIRALFASRTGLRSKPTWAWVGWGDPCRGAGRGRGV